MTSSAAHDPRFLLALARQAIAWHLEGRDLNRPGLFERGLPPAACFVSLKTRAADRLRGCIGTLRPVKPTAEEEVVANSVAAATRDPRFAPVREEELMGLRISIDLLSAPERVETPGQLNPLRYGVIVRAGERCGVLLPDLPGVESVEQQVSICRDKAGIRADAVVQLERFTVERIAE